MTEKFPEKARASPHSQPKPTRLNVRFAKGGELIQWERIEVVEETILEASDDSTSEESESDGEALPRLPAEPKQISVMLILQMATFAVAVAALIAAL